MNLPRAFALHPLVSVAGFFVAGLALARWFDPSPLLCLVLMAAMLIGWLSVDRRWPLLGQFILWAAVLCAGGASYQLDQRYGPNVHIARLITDTKPQMITRRVTTITAPDNAVVHSEQMASSAQFLAQVDEVKTESGWIAAAGQVLVKAPGGVRVRPGQRMELTAWTARPAGPANPGEFDYAAYLASSRIFVVLTVKHPGQIVPLDTGGTNWHGILQKFRLTLRAKLLGQVPADDPDSGHTMVALLLGHRDSSISDIGRAFAASGAAHLLAISGFHVVLIAGLAWLVLKWIIPRPRWRSAAVALLVVLYMAATPCGPPVLRAGLVMLLVLGATLLGRRPQMLNLLALALLMVLLDRPADFLDAGLQLSFIVTAGLITVVPRAYQNHLGRFLERRAAIARAIGTQPARLHLTLFRVCSTVFVANFVGTFLSMPLVAFHFHQVNPLSVVLGVLIVPFVLIGILLALVQLLASLAGAWLGGVAAIISVRWTDVMIWVMRHFAALPFAAIPVRPPPWYLVLLIYAAVILWIMRKSIKVSKATIMVCGCVPFPLLAMWYTCTVPPPALELWQLSVPRGACMVGRTADGCTFIINAGASGSQFGTRTLEPFLRINGMSRIDMAVFTSFGPAHAGAMVDLLAIRRPLHVFGSAIDPGRLSFAEDLPPDLPLQMLTAGQEIKIGKATTLDILWPPSKPSSDVPYAEKSLIICITTGNRRILIAGPRQDIALTAALQGQPPVDAVFFPGPNPPTDAAISAVQGVSPSQIVQDGVPRDSGTVLTQDSSAACVHMAISDARIQSEKFDASRNR